MIFRSTLSPQNTSGEIKPVFDVLNEVQWAATVADWFVTQPDHGKLSGEIAGAIDSRKVDHLSAAVKQAIGLHDMGWVPYDGGFKTPRPPVMAEDGHVLSFVNCSPERFLNAWSSSIQTAQSTGPLGGLLVSAHFARLTHPYLNKGDGTPEERAKVEQFLYREAERVDRLLPQVELKLEEVNHLLEFVGMCDLMSLYLCANPTEPVELPFELEGQKVTLSYEDGAYRMRPNMLDHVLIMEIPCLRSVDGKFEKELVPIKVQ
ncbi:MAG: DUF3891 family protein [Acidobacteriota bacterium]|nr:DUF3891 family protein [Acidobacteriota bacterium]